MDERKIIAKVGGEKEGYLLEFCADGIYLTVYPKDGTGLMFEVSDMRRVLKDFSVLDYDLMAMTDALRKNDGVPVYLGKDFTLPQGYSSQAADEEVDQEALQEHVEYGKVIVEIASDKLSAAIRFDVAGKQSIPTAEMIYEALQAKNVRYGINDEAVKEASHTGRPTEVAKGEAPQNGQDAQIIRKFNVGEKGVPVVDEHDRADYKNLNMFLRANKGQVLAERIPHTKGIPGTNVFGNRIMARNGKPKPVPAGKNTIIKDENFVVADMDGQIVDKGSKIDVDPRLEIKGDVCMETGNIDFDGSVTISGNVEAGFVVKAAGDIEIMGMVSAANVEGANIFIKGGVRGMNRGFIKARGDFHASFAENADIEAGGDIFIQDVAMHSTIRAGHHLIMDEGKGQITGGNLAAGEEIRARCIGNEANVITRLSVGVNPMLQKEYQQVLKEYNEAKKRLEMLNKTLSTLEKIDIKLLPPNKVEQMNSLVRSQFPLAGKVERSEKRLREIDAEMQNMKHGRVCVADTMYPGVRLSINSIVKNVQVKESHCTQYVKDDFIMVGAY